MASNSGSNQRAIAGDSPGWMVVNIGDTRVGLPVDAVGEVMPPPALSPVPMAPRWVVGIVSVRGEVIPVVDTGVRLGLSAGSGEPRLVLVAPDETGERVGLLFDGTAGLIERSAARVDAPADAATLPGHFVASYVADGTGRALPVLDLAALLDPGVPAAT